MAGRAERRLRDQGAKESEEALPPAVARFVAGLKLPPAGGNDGDRRPRYSGLGQRVRDLASHPRLGCSERVSGHSSNEKQAQRECFSHGVLGLPCWFSVSDLTA